MALVDALADFLGTELATPGSSTATPATAGAAVTYADLGGEKPLFVGLVGTRTPYVIIEDTQHPGNFATWPIGWALPPGFIARPDLRQLPGAQLPVALAGAPTITSEEPTPAAGFARLSAEEAWLASFDRRQREAPLLGEQIAAAEKRAARVVPGATLPRVPRASRPPRPPRAARPPRAPRAPRVPRVPGTKNARPPRPCRHRNSLGACIDGVRCIPGASIPNPTEGHSSCNWGPVDSCGNCVTQGCDSKAFSLLEPLLKLLPVKWTQESVAAANAPREVPRAPNGSKLGLVKLPPIGVGGIQGNPVAYPVDSRALVAGCSCYAWPWWVICPNCSGSAKCTCPGQCTPFPASSGNCGAP